MTYVFGYIVAVLLAVYLVPPVVLWRRVRIRSTPDMRELKDPAALPDGVRAYFDRLTPQLEALGFTHLVIARTRLTANFESFISLFANQSTGQSAVIVQSINRTTWKRLTAHLQFWTILELGQEIVTGNSRDLGGTGELPLYDGLNLPYVSDVRQLYQFHCWREAKLVASHAVRYVPAPENASEALSDSAQYHYRVGLLYGRFSSVDEQHYRWTLPAAFMVTWRLLPPMQQVGRWAAARRARRSLRAAMEAPVALPTGVPITHASPYRAGVPSFGFPVTEPGPAPRHDSVP